MRSGLKITMLFLCISAVSCSSLMVDKNTHDYPQASKDAFMSSCVTNSGGQQAACSCMFAKVEERYTYGEMEALEQKIKSGQPPQEFTDFMTQAKNSCTGGVTAPASSKPVQR